MSDASAGSACIRTLACVVASCTDSPPPPPSPAGAYAPPAPPLPNGAELSCLKTCAANEGADPATSALVQCATTHCGTRAAACAVGGRDRGCLGRCILLKCQVELAACAPKTASAPVSRCGDGLSCLVDAAAESGMYDTVRCLSTLPETDAGLLLASATCMEFDDLGSSACRKTVDTCACQTSAPIPSESSCLKAIYCPLDSPCLSKRCVASLSPPNRVLADALLVCKAAKCADCAGDACLVCLNENCAATFSSCLLDACPADADQAGSATCGSAATCIDDCMTHFSPCCISGCQAKLTVKAQKDWLALKTCAAGACGCLLGDVASCVKGCDACATERSACN